MDYELLKQRTREIALIMGQLLIFIFCLVYIGRVYQTNIWPDKHVNDNYNQTNCLILNSHLATSYSLVNKYRADFLINYSVNAMGYNQWVTGNGLDLTFASSKSSQEKILTKYTIGASYPCWYDPKDPRRVVLVLRHNWLSTLPLIIPLGVSMIMLYSLLMSLFKIFIK
jgi:hypothetical protein